MLTALTANSARAEVVADGAIKLPAVQAMIAKDYRYFSYTSEQSFRAAFVAVARGGHSDQFPLESISDNPEVVRALLDSLKA